MTNQEIIKSLEALKEQHRTGAAVLLEAAQHFARAVASQRDVECQDIDRLIKSLGGVPAQQDATMAAPETATPEIPAPASAPCTPEQEKQLADLRAACVKKAAAGGQKEILLFLQNHGARTIYELSPDFYPDLLKICQEVC